MYTKDLTVEIVTPVEKAFEGVAQEVILPGSEGEMAVLGGHAPVLSMLSPGVTVTVSNGVRRVFSTGEGFATITGGKVICLVDFATGIDKLDFELVQRDLMETREKLAADPGNALLRVKKTVLEAKMKAKAYGS